MYPPDGSSFNKQNWWGRAGDMAQWVRGLEHKRNWVQSPEPTEELGAEASASNPSSLEGLDRQVLGVCWLVSFPHSVNHWPVKSHASGNKVDGWHLKCPWPSQMCEHTPQPPHKKNTVKNTNIYSIAPANHCLILAIYVKSLQMFIVLCSFFS